MLSGSPETVESSDSTTEGTIAVIFCLFVLPKSHHDNTHRRQSFSAMTFCPRNTPQRMCCHKESVDGANSAVCTGHALRFWRHNFQSHRLRVSDVGGFINLRTDDVS